MPEMVVCIPFISQRLVRRASVLIGLSGHIAMHWRHISKSKAKSMQSSSELQLHTTSTISRLTASQVHSLPTLRFSPVQPRFGRMIWSLIRGSIHCCYCLARSCTPGLAFNFSAGRLGTPLGDLEAYRSLIASQWSLASPKPPCRPTTAVQIGRC